MAKPTLLLFPFLLLTAVQLFAQETFNRQEYTTEPDFLLRLKYFPLHCQSIDLGDYSIDRYPTQLRIDTLGAWFGHPVGEHSQVHIRTYYRPPFPRRADEWYRVDTATVRWSEVAFSVRWAGEYSIEVLDPTAPGLLRYDTRHQELTIHHGCNLSQPQLPLAGRRAAPVPDSTNLVTAHLETFGNTRVNFEVRAPNGSRYSGFARGAFPLEHIASQTGEYTIIFYRQHLAQRVDYLVDAGKFVSWRRYEATERQ